MISAIAIDDEASALQILEYYCEQLDYIRLHKTFTVADDALEYMRKYPVELLFLDIQMPGVLGTQFRKKIPEHILVIFITAYSHYAVQGYELDVIDFLLKPFSFDRFDQACTKARGLLRPPNHKPVDDRLYIYLRADYSIVKVSLADLLFIEGLEDYCKFHFDKDQPMIFRITMKSLVDRLPSDLFVRVHKSYIVRIDKVEKTRGNIVYLPNREIPIGRAYKKQILEIFNKERV